MEGKIITVVGIPGSGKTTLGENLSKKFGIDFLEENWKSIPFVHGKGAEKSSNFEICIGFLNMRFSQITKANEIRLRGNNVIIDTVLEMTAIYSRQMLDDEEYKEFEKVYNVYCSILPKPDLYLYLVGDLDVIRERALKRNLGIKIEQTMLSMENLLKAKEGIEEILSRVDSDRVLRVDVARKDVRTDAVMDSIAQKIGII
jgi:deoxyadenosine/deoxycytidine kinase